MTRRLATVRARTTLVASSVVAVALIVGAITLLILLRGRLIDAERSAASLRSRDIAALVESGRVADLLSYPGEESGFSQIVDSKGMVTAATRNIAGEPAVTGLRPVAGSNIDEIRSDLPIGDGQRFLISARSVDTGDGLVTVYTGASLDTADDTWRTVFIFLLIGSSLLVGLVALVTRIVVNRSLAPVEAIRSEVTAISEHELHKRVPEPRTGDEIDRLAASMNQMLDRLERSSVRQRGFVADASHELRSPLASARATLEVAAAHSNNLEDARRSIIEALVDHDRLEALVDDLLTLARLDDPGATPHDSIDFREVVNDVVASRPERLLGLALPPTPVPVRGNAAQLRRVVTNILDNALRHRAANTDVSLDVVGDLVILRVDDDGPGIPQAERNRVFERFVRLDDARTAERGTGLGLAIVKEIVTAHAGSVQIDTSPSGGARVEIRLPVPRTATEV